ncbi:hypothetical protein D3C75_428310 [compost metagenome]
MCLCRHHTTAVGQQQGLYGFTGWVQQLTHGKQGVAGTRLERHVAGIDDFRGSGSGWRDHKVIIAGGQAQVGGVRLEGQSLQRGRCRRNAIHPDIDGRGISDGMAPPQLSLLIGRQDGGGASITDGKQLYRAWPRPQVVDRRHQQISPGIEWQWARVIHHIHCPRQGQPDLVFACRQGEGVAIGFERYIGQRRAGQCGPRRSDMDVDGRCTGCGMHHLHTNIASRWCLVRPLNHQRAEGGIPAPRQFAHRQHVVLSVGFEVEGHRAYDGRGAARQDPVHRHLVAASGNRLEPAA